MRRSVKDEELEIVRFALAIHLDIEPGDIEEPMSLEDELGLDPLDLVLVVLRLEELGDVEFPVADLEGIQTVGDLTDVVRVWCRGLEEAVDAPDTVRGVPTMPPPPSIRTE